MLLWGQSDKKIFRIWKTTIRVSLTIIFVCQKIWQCHTKQADLLLAASQYVLEEIEKPVRCRRGFAWNYRLFTTRCESTKIESKVLFLCLQRVFLMFFYLFFYPFIFQSQSLYPIKWFVYGVIRLIAWRKMVQCTIPFDGSTSLILCFLCYNLRHFMQ